MADGGAPTLERNRLASASPFEPLYGFSRAVRVGDRIEVYASTQAPYMDKEEVRDVLGITDADVRIVPATCGGGFGGWLSGGAAARQQGCGKGRDQSVFHEGGR